MNKTVMLKGDEIYSDEIALFAKANNIDTTDKTDEAVLAELEAMAPETFVTVNPETRKKIVNNAKTILEALKREPNQTAAEISASTFINAKTVTHELAALFKDGSIVRAADAKKMYRYALDGDQLPTVHKTEAKKEDDMSKSKKSAKTKKAAKPKAVKKTAEKKEKKAKTSNVELEALSNKFKNDDKVTFTKKDKEITGKVIGRNLSKGTFTVKHTAGTSYPAMGNVKKA